MVRLGTNGPAAATIAAAETRRLARGGATEDVVDAARAWFQAGGGLTAAIEWLAGTFALGQPDDEHAARRALATALGGDAREAMLASAALLRSVHAPEEPGPLVVGTSDAARLANLELAPPGCDPRRRVAALMDLDGALGDEASVDAHALAGWSYLVKGDADGALAAFARVTSARAQDVAAWEGLRTAAEALGDDAKRAEACEQIGALCTDDARAADFWEQAALTWLALKDDARAEAAFDASFARDATRSVAFDKLFRRVRDSKDSDRLLAIIARRLDATDDPPEIAKLFWEQARVLREKGDQEGAVKALENVTMLEPDHVGALALTGEINIRRGNFAEAAEALARLALLDEAPAKSRVTAGVAAVDLYENKLNRFDRALEILLALHRSRLSTLPVRERLARAAARTGSWKEATAILEELMHERTEQDGRIEAARLAMAIHRDRLDDPGGARAAVVKLLDESPTDGEALDMLLTTDHEPATRQRLLVQSRVALVESLQRRPFDLPGARRLAKVARALGDDALQQAALSVSLVLGGHDAQSEQLFTQLSSRKPRTPQIALTDAIIAKALDPGDKGPIAALFTALGSTLAEALGPSLVACGVTKRDRVDPRSGIALRNEIAAWAGAFGIREFDLYVGGKDPLGVQGVPGETPALVVGAGVNAPLAPATRARVARELIAMVRGTTIARSRDDTTVAAIVVAACNLADVHVDAPPYAMLADVERLVGKAIPRKTKKLLPDICRAIVDSGTDARAWARRALSSQSRVAAIACGDAGVVLSDVMNEPFERLAATVKVDPRAEELLRFVLSPAYLDLRRSLGLEGSS
jgi:tetratricopeptide (TPR) repeat protein